jgi:hypothetical protein
MKIIKFFRSFCVHTCYEVNDRQVRLWTAIQFPLLFVIVSIFLEYACMLKTKCTDVGSYGEMYYIYIETFGSGCSGRRGRD